MTYTDEIRVFLHANTAETKKLTANESYIGTDDVILGVDAPTLRAFVQTWAKQHSATLTFDGWVATLDALYHGRTFEEKALAGLLLARFSAFRPQLSLNQLESWLDQLKGWAEVDSTCQSTFTAKEVLAKWEDWELFLRRLALDSNINKRRASLVLLIHSIRSSSDERLLKLALEQVEQLKNERDKLITKAISWLLREATKQHHDAIAAYLAEKGADLPKSVVREVQTKLTTGKKVKRPSSHQD